MFCQKCGAKLDDNACFCTTCGTKISTAGGEAAQPVQMSPAVGQIQQQMPYVWTGQAAQQPKKRKRKMPFFIGGVVLVLVLVVALLYVVAGSGSEIDYVRTVQEYTPFAESQGLSYTLQEVLDEYFEDLVWEERTEDDSDEHCVEIQGTLKMIEENIQLSVGVEDDPDDPEICYFSFRSLKFEDGTSSTDEDKIVYLLAFLFYGYDEGADIEEVLSEVDAAIAEENMKSDDVVSAGDTSYNVSATIGQTYSFDSNAFGNLEVTLNEVKAVDSYIDEYGNQIYPEDGYFFLWIAYTVNNIGTTNGQMPFGWNTLVYDGAYEYTYCHDLGDTISIPPLSDVICCEL